MAGLVFGALLMLAPAFGFLFTVFGMQRAFDTLGNSGISDPQQLAGHIGWVLLASSAGLILFPVGIIVFLFSLVFYFRARAATPPPLPSSVC